MIFEQSGWYTEDVRGNYVLVASDKDELIEYLEKEGELDDDVTEYICDNYDMEDFISGIMNGWAYMTREDMIESFKNHEIDEGKSFYSRGYEIEWFDEGDEIEEDE